MKKSLTRLLVGALLVPAPLALHGTATARSIDGGRFHDEFNLIHEDFCGVEGLTVSDVGTVDGSYRVVSRGRAKLAYFIEHFREHGVVTNLANDKFITFTSVSMLKDLKVTDNHDGTYTILRIGTGNVAMYGADGKAIGRNPGQSRAEFLGNDAGTPDDPFDDPPPEFVREVKASTGVSDDLCAAMVAELT